MAVQSQGGCRVLVGAAVGVGVARLPGRCQCLFGVAGPSLRRARSQSAPGSGSTGPGHAGPPGYRKAGARQPCCSSPRPGRGLPRPSGSGPAGPRAVPRARHEPAGAARPARRVRGGPAASAWYAGPDWPQPSRTPAAVAAWTTEGSEAPGTSSTPLARGRVPITPGRGRRGPPTPRVFRRWAHRRLRSRAAPPRQPGRCRTQGRTRSLRVAR